MAGKRKAKKSVLKVDSPSKIPQLESILKEGKVTIVLVFADWCGHCHRFQKDIWEPMCKKEAIHNRVAVRDDMIKNTSLANTKFNYLPSVLVVNEKGEPETFTTPDGEMTNAIPTPKNQNDMEKIVNVPLTPMNKEQTIEPLTNSSATLTPMKTNSMGTNTMGINTMVTNSMKTNSIGITPTTGNKPMATPIGQSYTPTPYPKEQKEQREQWEQREQKGGAFYETMKQVSQGIFPIAVLGGLSYALKGGTRKQRYTKKRKTRRILKA